MPETLASLVPYLTTVASGCRYRAGCAAAGFEPADLAQMTLERAIEAGDRLPKRESDRQRYILRIMANLLNEAMAAAAAQKRGAGRITSIEEVLATLSECSLRLEDIVAASGPGPRTLAQRREVQRLVAAEIQALPPAQRAAVELHLVTGCTLAETAEQMGWSEGQTRGYVERGRETLRARLNSRGLKP
jgi:RNA polymerase sigma factor (sigma-70 family)